MTLIIEMILAVGLSGCSWLDEAKVTGKGAVIEQHQPMDKQVTRVLAEGPANIHLVVGEASGIHIKGQENLLPYLVLTERGDKLEIEVKEGYRLEPTEPLDLTITLPQLHELALTDSGSGDLQGFKGDKLVLSVAGSGDIVASKLALNRLEGNISGSGNLDLGDGSATAMKLNIAGSGDVQGANLKGEKVEVNIAGSGNVEVRARERLKVGIAGSGSVSYWGDPTLESKIAGSGDVTRQGS